MAIFCMLNGGIGIIYAFIKIVQLYNIAKLNWFSFYHNILFLIGLYAIFVYLAICHLSYHGIIKYQMGFGSPQGQSTNYGTSYGSTNISEENKNKFTAFKGKGQIVG